MNKNLPPLGPLKAFDCACRHMSFTKAGEEMGLTQAAISHQIKSLEEALGVRLFKRMNRTLILTEEGQLFLPHVREALQTLVRGVERIKERSQSNVLKISVLLSFATAWLVRKLSLFRQQNPDIIIRLFATDRLVDFGQEDVDIAIRFGSGPYEGLKSERFLDEQLFPVASPEFLKQTETINNPQDLLEHTLLYDYLSEGWKEWFAQAGMPDVHLQESMQFSHSDMVLQAAIDGQGIALGRQSLARDPMNKGLLVRLCDESLTLKDGYYLVGPKRLWDTPQTKAFRTWLKLEINRSFGEQKE